MLNYNTSAKSLSSVIISLTFGFVGLLSCGGGGSTPQPPPSPSISSFTLSPTAIGSGQSSQLTAVFSNGTGRVEPGPLNVTSGVAQSVAPSATTNYVLTVTNDKGTSATQSQTLNVYPAPVISFFSATYSTITSGTAAELLTNFTGGTGVVTPGNLQITSGTPIQVTPAITTTYTLTVTPTAGAAATKTITVSVVPAATISAFTASPISIREGSSTRLSFTFIGVSGTITPGGIAVTSGGSMTVSPTSTTTYTLVVKNNLGSPVTADVTVSVIPLPVLTSTAPAQIAYGQTLAFKVSGVDELGSPLGPFVLDFGPQGMTVNASGDVTWTASLPLFDKKMDVKWGISVPSYPGLKLRGNTRIEDPARAMPLRRTGTEIPIWNSGLVVTDLNGDGRAEMLIAGRLGLYVQGWNGTTYVQQWSYPYSISPGESVGAVAARDLDGDKQQEIFFSSGNVLVKLDGASRREVARYVAPNIARIADIKIADLDKNGTFELVCLGSTQSYGSDAQVIVLDAGTLVEKWRTPTLGLGASIAVGNVDADPTLEIVTAGGYVFDGVSGQNKWAYGPGFGVVVGTGDLDGDGTDEIVGMQDWSAFRGFSAILKSPIWEQTGFDFDAMLVTDLDGDGRAEIIIGDGQWGNVTGYRYVKSTNSLSQVFQINSQDHGVTSIGAGDVDGDGSKEIVWGSGGTSSGADVLVVAGFHPGITVKWTNTSPKQLDGPFMGAFWARISGGVSRLMFGVPSTDSGYSGTRLVALDPASGALAVSKELGSNWSRSSALDVMDYDGTGFDKILVATAGYYDGYLVAFNFSSASTQWTSAQGIGEIVAIVHADLNNDGYPDLIAITWEGYVYAYDIRHGALIWKSTGLGSGSDVGVADLDGDGVPEIIAVGGGRVVAFKKSAAPGLYTESVAYTLPDARGLVIADTDGDGIVELHILSGSGYSGNSTVTHLDRNLSLLGSFTVPVQTKSLHLEELGSGRRNLLISVADTDNEGAHIQALDAVSGLEIWRSPFLWGSVPAHSLHYVDTNGDGIKEIAFGTTEGMYSTR